LKNIVAIIQARNGSTRMPGKIFKELSGKPLISHICDRLNSSRYINQVLIATTLHQRDDILESWALQNKISCFRGSEDNVLSRYYHAAMEADADIIVRITGDDPFKEVNIIDNVIELLYLKNLDFACNNFPPTFPEGLDVEVFTFASLKHAFENVQDPFEMEHVTQFFYKNPHLFKIENYVSPQNLSYLRLTVDTPNDFKFAEEIYKRLYTNNNNFGLDDILALMQVEPDLLKINFNEKRSDMYKNLTK
jgi:spore coat polysaccharide biosynthesis protein SpsF